MYSRICQFCRMKCFNFENVWKDDSKLFLFNRKVSKLFFLQYQIRLKNYGHPYKSKNFDCKIQQQQKINQKDAEIRLNVPKILLFMKNHL